MLKKLQIWHLVFLFLAPILYAIFKLNSGADDHWRNYIDIAFILSSTAWASFITVKTVIAGTSQNIASSVFSVYRNALTKKTFLIISNLGLTTLVGLFCYQLLAYRQVSFIANKNADVYLNDTVGEEYKLGTLKQGQESRFRLHIGQRYIVFKSPISSEVLGSGRLDIEPIWQDSKPIEVKKSFEDEPTYEPLQ